VSDNNNNNVVNPLNNINKIVSEGGPSAKQIIKFIKQDNEVTGYVLSSGEKVSVKEAIELAKEGRLEHVGVSTSKDGSEYIRSLPDGDESNNLSHLPSITEME
jgi:hypothetical protein